MALVCFDSKSNFRKFCLASLIGTHVVSCFAKKNANHFDRLHSLVKEAYLELSNHIDIVEFSSSAGVPFGNCPASFNWRKPRVVFWQKGTQMPSLFKQLSYCSFLEFEALRQNKLHACCIITISICTVVC